VYSGGDDVLAFVPLHRALECNQSLANAFRELVNDELRSRLRERGSSVLFPSSTLSAGLAVVHHLEPLQDALACVRSAKRAAKQVRGKNALAVTVAKRAGADFTIKDSSSALHSRLRLFAGMHRRGEVPDGAAFELRRLAREMEDLPAAVPDEVVRILGRKRVGGLPLAPGVREGIRSAIIEMNNDVGEVALELIAARLIAEAEDLAAADEVRA
jgi:CRISPR-associated protein Cmr2